MEDATAKTEKKEPTLEQAIRDNASLYGLEGSEYMVRVNKDRGEKLEVYIRPFCRDGSTVDFIVQGNKIEIKK